MMVGLDALLFEKRGLDAIYHSQHMNHLSPVKRMVAVAVLSTNFFLTEFLVESFLAALCFASFIAVATRFEQIICPLSLEMHGALGLPL